jgi:hypothetical protein
MPAKKQKKGGGAKAKKKANKNQQQKVKKIVEDKTFGKCNSVQVSVASPCLFLLLLLLLLSSLFDLMLCASVLMYCVL